VDGRGDVREVEFVSRDLAVRMHVPFAQQQHELVFGELGIEPRHRKHMES